MFKIQDGGDRHLGFTMFFNNFRTDETILTKFHEHTPGTNCNRSNWSKMLNFQNPRWRRTPSWICPNVNNFHTDEAILTKFHEHAQGLSGYRHRRSEMLYFQNPKIAAAAILDFPVNTHHPAYVATKT
jgi:hypothetical protein